MAKLFLHLFFITTYLAIMRGLVPLPTPLRYVPWEYQPLMKWIAINIHCASATIQAEKGNLVLGTNWLDDAFGPSTPPSESSKIDHQGRYERRTIAGDPATR